MQKTAVSEGCFKKILNMNLKMHLRNEQTFLPQNFSFFPSISSQFFSRLIENQLESDFSNPTLSLCMKFVGELNH